MLVAANTASGVRPNRILYADDTWAARLGAYESINTPAAGVAASLDLYGLAKKLLVDKVNVGKARYTSGAANAKSQITTSLKVYAYFVESIAMIDDSSHIKRFVYPCEDGQMVRVFIERGMKYTDISVEFYSIIVAAQTIGLPCLTIALK